MSLDWRSRLHPLAREARGPAGFLLLALFVFRSAVFEGRVLFRRDIGMVWLPQVESFVRCVAGGSWPFWDPYPGFGRPLLADPRAEVLYPPTWLNLVMAPWHYYTLFVVAHLVFSAHGMSLLARRWGLTETAAFTTGAIWLASGPFLSLGSMWHHMAGAAWIPWVFLTLERAAGSGRLRDRLACGAALAAQVFAGSPDFSALTVAALVPYLAVRGRLSPAGTPWRSAAMALAFGLGVSAVQWLPTLAAALESRRTQLSSAASATWSLHPVALAEVLLPLSWASLPLLPEQKRAWLELREPWLHSIHLGAPALALAAAGAASRRPRALFLAALGAGALLFALGRHALPYEAAAAALPALRMLRFPVKAMVLCAFAWSLLAGIGVDVWRGAFGTAARGLAAAGTAMGGTLLLALAGVVACVYGAAEWAPWLLETAPGQSAEAQLAPVAARLAATALLAGLVLALAWARSRRPICAGAAGAALASLAVLTLIAVHADVHWTAPRELLSARPAVLALIDRSQPARLYVYDYGYLEGTHSRDEPRAADSYRIARAPAGFGTVEALMLGAQLYLMPPTAARWGLAGSYDRDVLGFDPPRLLRLNELLRQAEGTPLHLRLLRMGSVTHVLALTPARWWQDLVPVGERVEVFEQPIHVFRVPDPLPRAYVVDGVRVADGEAAHAIVQDPAFDPRRELILPAGQPRAASATRPGSARVARHEPDRVRVEAELTGDAFLVLTEAFDHGWRAAVNGRAATVLRANVAFRAVALPAGRHVVDFVYRPRWGLAGLALTLASLLAAGAAAAPRSRRGAR